MIHGNIGLMRLTPVAYPAAGALALAVAVACGGDRAGRGDVQRSDSAGVEIVLNAADDLILDWTFIPRLTLGGQEEGPASFYELSASNVAVDSSGRLFVLDESTYRLVAFTDQGEVLWTARRENTKRASVSGEPRMSNRVRTTGCSTSSGASGAASQKSSGKSP